MGAYDNLIAIMESEEKKRKEYVKRREKLEESHQKVMNERELLLEASRILATLSDNQLAQLIDIIEKTINGVLAQVFSADDPRTIRIDKGLVRETNPQLKANLYTKDMISRDIADQTGTGLKQIVSVMFSLVVVSVREDRPIIIMDECLSGLHNKAKKVMKEIIRLFSKKGFQFLLVEYGIDDLGKIYNVEKFGETAKVVPVKGEYNPDKKFLDEPDTTILDEEYEEKDEGYDLY